MNRINAKENPENHGYYKLMWFSVVLFIGIDRTFRMSRSPLSAEIFSSKR